MTSQPTDPILQLSRVQIALYALSDNPTTAQIILACNQLYDNAFKDGQESAGRMVHATDVARINTLLNRKYPPLEEPV